MDTSTMSLTETPDQRGTAEEDLFDLDIGFIESEAVIPELLRSTSDNCGRTCASACNSCRS
jgi:FxLD family lantipeptide